MRVLNDKPQQDQKEVEGVGFGLVVLHSLFTALGISSMMLSPLPLIASHLQLTQPWPKITALLGALIALRLLNTPILVVAVLFVFGLYAADSYTRAFRPWQLLINSALVAISVGAIALLVSSQMHDQSLGDYWATSIDTLVARMKETDGVLQLKSVPDWAAFRDNLLFRGPFLFLSGMILSLWFSMGLVAHYGWADAQHPCSAGELRKMRINPVATFVFLVLLVASLFVKPEWHSLAFVLAGGAVILLATAHIIQGYVLLSCFFERARVGHRVRTLAYVLAFFVAYPVLVILGILSPWAQTKIFLREEQK